MGADDDTDAAAAFETAMAFEAVPPLPAPAPMPPPPFPAAMHQERDPIPSIIMATGCRQVGREAGANAPTWLISCGGELGE